MYSIARTHDRSSRWVYVAPLACALSSLVLATGCDSGREASAPRADTVRDVKREALLGDQVWITTARDSIALVERVLGSAAPLRDEHADKRESDEVALLVPRAYLADISDAQHEEHHRCGGFVLQETEDQAMAALHAEVSPLLAPAYTLDNQATVAALLPEVKEANVLATIRKLSSYRTRFHTSTTGEEAALYIRDTWKMIAAGRDDIEVALVDHEKTPQPSIKMTIRGTRLPDELVVLGGHMDSISGRGSNTAVAPGADDNASGIAVITEIARAAVELDYRPERTLVFYGYAAEEIGLVGSAEIAARAKADGLIVHGVMQLDMTNYTTASKPYIGIVTDFTNSTLNAFSIELIEEYLDIPYKQFECGYGCSDHASWTKNGFPATSPHEANMEEGNQRIHTPDDTLALSKDSAAHSMHFARFGVAFMAELGKGKLAVPEPACSPTKACPSGQRCEDSMCVPGVDDAGTSPSGLVDACTTGADCAAGQACESGRCTENGAASEPECSATQPCPSGLTCAGGACVAPGGAVGARDAGPTKRDASTADAGRKKPTPADEPNADDEDEASDPRADEDDEGPAATSASGCSVAATGGAQGGAWLLSMLTTLLVVQRRRSIG